MQAKENYHHSLFVCISFYPFTKAIKDDKPLDKDVVRAQEIMAS